MTLPEKALEVIKGEIGKEEIPRGSNWGPHVQKYLAAVGIKFPAPWCMALVYWCFEEAARLMGVINPAYKTGHVLTQYKLRKDRYGKISPRPGDVYIMDYGNGTGHTGIVETVEGVWVRGVEGNTNDEGSREGFEICRMSRPISKIKCFLRFE